MYASVKHLLKHARPAKQDMMAKHKHNTVHVPVESWAMKRLLFYDLRLKHFFK